MGDEEEVVTRPVSRSAEHGHGRSLMLGKLLPTMDGTIEAKGEACVVKAEAVDQEQHW